MVKIGFLCEGETERLLIESANFQQLLNHYQVACVFPVIDAKGNGNLLPQNIAQFRSTLQENGADKILILTDLDQDQCITLTRDRITQREDQIIVVAVKQIEAWFLADSQTLSKLVRGNVEFEYPENEQNAFQKIRSLMMTHTGRATPSKIILAKKFMDLGFSVENAAKHVHCYSARYFLHRLAQLTSQ